MGGRSNVAAASGPRGTAVAGSRSGFAAGSGGMVAGGDAAGGLRRAAVAASRRTGGYGAAGFRPYGFNAYGGYHRAGSTATGTATTTRPGAGATATGAAGAGAAGWGWGSAWGWARVRPGVLGLRLVPLRHGLHALLQPLLRLRRRPWSVNQPVVAVPYDYSQPIDTTGAPASATVADPAMATFDAARASFKQGDYDQALQQTDDALAKLPNDTALHEFRALCLFALGRYDEAAATLYAVLSVGPGWDWTTLIGLYPDVDVYTAQLRALEAYCNANPTRPPPRFVLAYHYLTQGHTEAAVDVLKQVVALKPSDTLSAKLLRQLDPPKDQPATATDRRRARTRPGRHDPAPGRVDRRDLERPAGRRHRDRPDDPARRAASPGRSPRRARRSSSPAPRPSATASSRWPRTRARPWSAA